MIMPTIEAYARALQDRGNIALPLLCNMKLTCNNEGTIPRFWAGAFGVVFRFERSNGTTRAVKCFTKGHRTNTERYEAIAAHLDGVFYRNSQATQFLVNLIFTQRGVRVKHHWRPLLLMDWVNGVFLNKHINDLCKKTEAENLIAAIADQWIDLAIALKNENIAHGDLQHGNVLVLPSGKFKLIDYDGMCVPALANRYVMEGGHLNYQHPARSLRFDENLDTFSNLVILTALTALSLKPSLWSEFNKGNNMLFCESDFKAPDMSPLFRTLRQVSDCRLSYLVRELENACNTKDATAIKPFEEIVASLTPK